MLLLQGRITFLGGKIMKRLTAFFICILLMFAVTATGCSSGSSSSGTVKTKTLAENDSISAQSVTEDTMYDQDTFSITIPKGWTVTKEGLQYSWLFEQENYAAGVLIVDYDTLAYNIAMFAKSQESAEAFIGGFETGSGNTFTLDRSYKHVDLDGKGAILINGTWLNGNGYIKVYLVESSSSLLCVMVMTATENGDSTLLQKAETLANTAFSTLKIK